MNLDFVAALIEPLDTLDAQAQSFVAQARRRVAVLKRRATTWNPTTKEYPNAQLVR